MLSMNFDELPIRTMNNIPQPDDAKLNQAPSESENERADTNPLMPGTEQPRSLGDMMREAEQKMADKPPGELTESDAGKAAEASGPAKKRVKKVSRSQSRRHARERALQALYQWDVSDTQASDVRKQFLDDQDMSRVDVAYFEQLFNGVSLNPQPIDDAMAASLDRPVGDLDPIERSVLRIATYELTQCLDIPARVVINEGIEVTKRFGADMGHKYINGVLDKLAMEVRPLEMKRR